MNTIYLPNRTIWSTLPRETLQNYLQDAQQAYHEVEQVQTNLNNEVNNRGTAETNIQNDVNNKYNDLNGRKADRSQLPFPENMKVQLFTAFYPKGTHIGSGDDTPIVVNLPTVFTGGFHYVFSQVTSDKPPVLSSTITNNSQLNIYIHQTQYDYLVRDLTVNFMALGYY